MHSTVCDTVFAIWWLVWMNICTCSLHSCWPIWNLLTWLYYNVGRLWQNTPEHTLQHWRRIVKMCVLSLVHWTNQFRLRRDSSNSMEMLMKWKPILKSKSKTTSNHLSNIDSNNSWHFNLSGERTYVHDQVPIDWRLHAYMRTVPLGSSL